MLTIERLAVTASLDDPTAALQRACGAADAGDESWAQWVSEYDRGDALIVRLDVTVDGDDGDRRRIEVANLGVFVEADSHPPKVERQIYDIVSKDFEVIARELSKLGADLDEWDLCEMYVHVDLADDLMAALKARDARGSQGVGVTPQADARLSQPGGPVRWR